MTTELMSTLIFTAGLGHVALLTASFVVPLRVNWRGTMRLLPRLHRQMCYTYAGYTGMSIVAFALLSLCNAHELAAGSPLARGLCAYIAVFWGIRLGLQGVFDVKEHLTAWWTKAGYLAMTLLFVSFIVIYALASAGLAH
jgi:hypothetical protein